MLFNKIGGNMDKQQAFKILQQAVSMVRGTLQEHQAIQTALETLRPEVKQEETKEGE